MAHPIPTTAAGKRRKASTVMEEYHAGTLHSGKGGPIVKSERQAKAIAMRSSGQSRRDREGFRGAVRRRLRRG